MLGSADPVEPLVIQLKLLQLHNGNLLATSTASTATFTPTPASNPIASLSAIASRVESTQTLKGKN